MSFHLTVAFGLTQRRRSTDQHGWWCVVMDLLHLRGQIVLFDENSYYLTYIYMLSWHSPAPRFLPKRARLKHQIS